MAPCHPQQAKRVGSQSNHLFPGGPQSPSQSPQPPHRGSSRARPTLTHPGRAPWIDPRRVRAPFQDFPYWLWTLSASDGRPGHPCHSCPQGLLEATWGTEPGPGSGFPLKQLMEPGAIRWTPRPFFPSSARADACSVSLLGLL